ASRGGGAPAAPHHVEEPAARPEPDRQVGEGRVDRVAEAPLAGRCQVREVQAGAGLQHRLHAPVERRAAAQALEHAVCHAGALAHPPASPSSSSGGASAHPSTAASTGSSSWPGGASSTTCSSCSSAALPSGDGAGGS